MDEAIIIKLTKCIDDLSHRKQNFTFAYLSCYGTIHVQDILFISNELSGQTIKSWAFLIR